MDLLALFTALTIGLGLGVSAPDYEIEAGVSGFTAHSVQTSAPAPDSNPFVVEPEPTVSADPAAVVQWDREPVAASRNEARPPAPEPEPQVQDAPSEAVATPPAPVEIEAPSPEPAITPAPTGGVIGVAAQYVGYPYVLYGTPPQSFDCSAYTWYVFQQAGIDIPRSVNGQKAAVTPVSNPQPGDLVFYNDFHHVGIYAGNGMTYEALNPGAGVRYGPLVSSNVWYGRIG